MAVGVAGKADDAERMLRGVIDRATEHGRPLLVAVAQRDLAYLWARDGQGAASKEMARAARATFHRLGSKVEIEKMTALLTQPHIGTPGLGRAEAGNPPTAPGLGAPMPTRDPSVPKNERIGPP